MKGNRLLASGTSFSTAYISGVAAKLMTEYRDLTTARYGRSSMPLPQILALSVMTGLLAEAF